MIDPIVIDFAVRNLGQVSAAFETIETRIQKMERMSTSTAEQQSKVRIRTAQDEAKQREQAAAKATKEKERIERQATRDMEAESARRDGIVRKSSEMAGRYASQLAKQEQREAQEATRAIEREEDRKMRIRIRSSEMAGRAAAQEAAQEIAAANRASSAWGQRGRRIGGIVSGSVGSLVSGAGAMVGATLGIGGGMMLANAAHREMSFERTAALLVNAGTANGVAPGTIDDVRKATLAESIRTGMSKEDLANAALSYSHSAKGGDFKGALGNMGFFAQLSRTTGADINDVASSAGILQSQNPNLDTGKMQQLLRDVVAQTHAGSLSMPEVAKMAGELGSTRSSYAGDEMTNQRKLIGLAQLARSEVASPEEAGVAIKDLSLEAGKHRKSTASHKGLEAMGVKFDEHGKMQSVEQMVNAVFTDTKGDITKIQDALGSQRATPLFRALAGKYNGAGGGQAGLDAVNKEMASVTSATMSKEQMESQDKLALDTPAEKMSIALNKVTTILEEKLAPRMASFAETTLPKLVDKFEFVVDEATKFADWFADNPIKGVGAIVLAAVSKDLASAGIGAGVKVVLENLLKSMGGAGGGGVGAGGALTGPAGALSGSKRPGTLGTLGAIAGGATVGIAIGEALAPVVFDPLMDAKQFASDKRDAKTISGVNTAAELRAKTRSGHVTAADIAAAQSQAAALGKQSQEQSAYAGSLRTMANIPLVGALQKDAASGAEGAAKNTKAALDDLTKALAMASANLAKLGSTAANTDPGAVRRNLPINQRPVQ